MLTTIKMIILRTVISILQKRKNPALLEGAEICLSEKLPRKDNVVSGFGGIN